ncbi:MAG TPA: hypothetical protein DCZ94_11620 [Lentisphaeria bacterium]|nr:MAG: hypothetical protein A2X48_00410 [Lentisphaerae bacterium GWF2_49_21]HBC87596.1 hypothetical protein [Lentisphaeria bacterium]
MIDIGSCFNYGIEQIKKNPAFYIGGILVVMGISIGINLVAQGFSFIWGLAVGFLSHSLNLDGSIGGILAMGGGAIIGIVLGFLIAPFFVGYFKGLKKEYEGGTGEIGDVFSGFGIMVPSILNYAVANLVVVAGFICCIIPGILLSPIIMMTVFFLAKEKTDGLTAVKSSWGLLKKNPIIILWYYILTIFGMLGLILCIVGIVITVPISLAAMYKMFQQALGEDNPVPAAPAAKV